jgi:8-oxo-dGTP pyrophosphatase MutT (NUDIX family)
LELGESPAEAVVRETREESGHIVTPTSVLGVFGGPEGFTRTYRNGDQIECVDILFECRISQQAHENLDQEVAEVALKFPHEINNWLYPISVDQLVEAAVDKKTLAGSNGQVGHLGS